MVRSQDKAEKFRALGLNAVVGSNEDEDLLTAECAKADVIFSTVCRSSPRLDVQLLNLGQTNCDDVKAINATLAGMKKRFELTGKQPSLIHTSGTGVLADETGGNRASETIYSDMNIPLIETLPATQPHRPVDLAIVAADEAGMCHTQY